MGNPMLHYYFTKDLINSLEQKYLDQTVITDYRIFLFSDFFDLGSYYKYSNFRRKDPYNLSYKFQNLDNPEKLFSKAVEYVKENGYSKDNIFILYALVSNFIYYQKISSHLKNSHIKNYGFLLENIVAKKRENIDLFKTNIVKKFKGAFLFNFADLDMIDYLTNKIFFFSKGETYYQISLKKYKRHLHINYKKPYKLNPQIDYFMTFEIMYDNALKEAKNMILAVNEALFLGNDKVLTEYLHKYKKQNR